MPEPALPEGIDLAELQAITLSQTWLEECPGHPAALRRMTVNGVICSNAMASVYQSLGYKQEAQQGLLPVLLVNPFHDVETQYGIFGSPETLECVGWVERDEGTFGPAIIPPPMAIIGGSAPAPKLPRPENDNGPPAPSSPPSTLSPGAAEPVPEKPANDPLASFRPASAGKRPAQY
jgi:hypothetical protein